ncbi:MAG: topoisomerase C-terminal repeat-containing protein [Dysgonamonadaceae bacterium]|jgi:DNA topoisomerase-3|nr:topoisomerase C-terminal repeat-containing protein [Dysgonamonadaceae bacterium]
MIAIIAEKPSVAREIAAIVGASRKEDGFLQGNNYMVTWALGHLVCPAMPEDYGFTGFVRENLPIIPTDFILKPRQINDGKQYKPDAGALKQLKIIRGVFDGCDKIIVATDAGREGELIFRYIYSYLNCRKPFERLWISSLTDRAIKEGLQNLRPGGEYDNLYQSAKARSEADWLIGINASQALSITAGSGVWSLGRVQTPTLAMICKRYLENKEFVPSTYFQLKVEIEKSGIGFSAISIDKYERKETGLQKLEAVKPVNSLTVRKIEKKDVTEEPPLLYDLTTLQKEANTKHSFSADKTLSIAQKLYEAKLITYPRTSSRYIPTDVFEDIPHLISNLSIHPIFGIYALKMGNMIPSIRSVDDTKITDHHAMIVTENEAKNLSLDEQIIYDMIVGRMLESFSSKSVKKTTRVELIAAGTVFEAKGSSIFQIGWKQVFGPETVAGYNEKEGYYKLPKLEEGEDIPFSSIELLEKQTKPKPLHTEGSLLAAMESCGKDIENEAEREAIKESGIGTPATRAAIIETLFAREYIQREKKSLVPTNKGLVVYLAVKDKKIADVSMTGGWEAALSKIGSGEMNADTFRRGIEVYSAQITSELLDAKVENSNNRISHACPKCKSGKVVFYPKVAKCKDENCGLVIFRTIAGKELSDIQLACLIEKGSTGLIKGFKGKLGKVFDASIVFDNEFKTTFEFPKSSKKRK